MKEWAGVIVLGLGLVWSPCARAELPKRTPPGIPILPLAKPTNSAHGPPLTTTGATQAPPPASVAPRVSYAPAIVFASLGLVGLSLGASFGYLALEEKAIAEDHCSQSQRLCDVRGAEANRVGRRYSTIGLTALAFGGAAALTSLWFFSQAAKKTKLGAKFSPTSASLRLSTQF